MLLKLEKATFQSKLIHIASISTIVLVMSGCMANMTSAIGIDSTNTAMQNEKFIQGDYNASATLAVENKDLEAELDEANLLSTLRAGNTYLYANNYTESKKMLDEAEAIIKFHHEEALASSITDYMAQLALNDAAIDYHATITESIMVNTYKSLTLMAERNFDSAHVELNRAVDRQRRAKETYAELIGKQKEAIDKEKEKRNGSSSGMDKSFNNDNISGQVEKNNPFGSTFEAYPDFVNPFTTYLAGLFFALEGDYSKSAPLLREVTGMMPNNKVVASDYKMVDAAADGRKIKESYVWVIFEDGLAPIKTEYKLNVPLFLFTDKVIYSGIALPKMHVRSEEFSNMQILNNNKKLTQTEILADMDRVILTEFKYGYNDVLMRAVFSTIIKTYAQYEAKQSNGYFGMAMAAYQGLTTHADTRTWSTLPKNFQIARVKMPKDRTLDLTAGAQHINVKIAELAKNAIVYVRIPTAMSKPSVSVINF